MNNLQISQRLLILGCLLYSTASLADDTKPRFSFDAGVGYLNDSNVGIADLDTNSGASDSATTYDLGLSARLPLSRRWETRIGYDYSATAYSELSEFDLGLHHALAGLTWKTGILDAGINIEKFAATLDGEDYLDMVQVSPSISRLIGNRVFLRGAYMRSDKRYDAIAGRDAVNEAWRGDIYMLIDNMDQYVAIGIQSGKEDADDAAFDYDSLRWNMSYGQLLALGSRDLKLKAKLSHEGRSYLNTDESIGDRRSDKRLRLRLAGDLQLFEHLALAAHVEHSDIRSNLASAALDKTVYGLALKATF